MISLPFAPLAHYTSVLVKFTYHVTLMLEKNSYVGCLLVDFSEAFHVVRHSVLLSKITRLVSFQSCCIPCLENKMARREIIFAHRT